MDWQLINAAVFTTRVMFHFCAFIYLLAILHINMLRDVDEMFMIDEI